MTAAVLILLLIAGYSAAGLLFSVAFITVGVSRVDSAARGAPIGFRLLILPGTVALWPYLLVRWARHAPSAATEH